MSGGLLNSLLPGCEVFSTLDRAGGDDQDAFELPQEVAGSHRKGHVEAVDPAKHCGDELTRAGLPASNGKPRVLWRGCAASGGHDPSRVDKLVARVLGASGTLVPADGDGPVIQDLGGHG